MNEKEHLNYRLILCAVLIAVFVVPSSISGTAIALPYISRDMQIALPDLHWVVNGFNLSFACFTLVWGKISDIFGRKKSFVTGVTLVALASLFSVLSRSGVMLDLARVFAGIGGAAIFSCGSALLIEQFRAEQRVKAFALFGMTAGLGITAGPTLSGVLLEFWSWPSIFLFHLVTMIVVLVLCIAIPADKPLSGGSPGVSVTFDFTGTLLFISAMLALMLLVSNGQEWGYSSVMFWLIAATGIIAMFFFSRHSKAIRNPLLNVRLLRHHRFLGYTLVPVVASFTFVTLLTYFPAYLSGPAGLSPLDTGLMMICLTAPVLIFPLLAGHWANQGMRIQTLLLFSLIGMLSGLAALLVTITLTGSLAEIGASLFVIGTGMGLSAGLVDGQALECVEDNQAGMAAGLLNTFRLGSEAFAVALYGMILSSSVRNTLVAGTGSESAQFLTSIHGAVAAGDFSPLLTTKAKDTGLFDLVSEQYTHAFLFTNLIMLLTGLLIRLFCVHLIRREAQGGQVKKTAL